MVKKHNREFLISELHRFKRENGRIPTVAEMNPKNGYPSSGAYQNHFGTFNNALKVVGFTINKRNDRLTGFETCYICGSDKGQYQGWHTKGVPEGEVMCPNCYSKFKSEYMNGNLDVNNPTGRGRAGEILVLKTLDIGTEHDCNMISWGHKVDLYHNEYKKIDVKTSLLGYKRDNWSFNFRAKKEVNTYICIGLSYDGKYVQHVWIVPNEGYIKNLKNLTIYDTHSSLSNREHWESYDKMWNDMWQEMIINYQKGECKIFR